jgi:hypothetical protein
VKTRMSELKGQGDEAFKKQDYLKASVFYTQVFPSTFFPLYNRLEVHAYSYENGSTISVWLVYL